MARSIALACELTTLFIGFDGQQAASVDDLHHALAKRRRSSTVNMAILRGGASDRY